MRAAGAGHFALLSLPLPAGSGHSGSARTGRGRTKLPTEGKGLMTHFLRQAVLALTLAAVALPNGRSTVR